MSWEPATFEIAMPGAPMKVAGYVYRGLGIHMAISGSPKGRRKPLWVLSHLNSGHGIARLIGLVADAFPIASEIAEAGDWSFDGVDGWKNQFPEAPDVVRAIVEREGKRVKSGTGGRFDRAASEPIARQICAARESA